MAIDCSESEIEISLRHDVATLSHVIDFDSRCGASNIPEKPMRKLSPIYPA
jgi:hypothetical protein